MSDDLTSSIQPAQKLTLGDRIRGIANQLRQENDVQIKATARILGAAAQIAQNHDRLIDEVTEMVEEDLNWQEQVHACEPYTVAQLQRQYPTLKAAKAHFGIKASSWVALVSKLNQQPMNSGSPVTQPQDALLPRLEVIELELQAMRNDMNQILNLLSLMAEKIL